MNSLVLTPANFGKKIGSLYGQVLKSGRVSLTITTPKARPAIVPKAPLAKYLDSDEYRNDPGERFESMGALIADLKKRRK